MAWKSKLEQVGEMGVSFISCISDSMKLVVVGEVTSISMSSLFRDSSREGRW